MEKREPMKIIAGERRTGRTTELIKMAVKNKAYILVSDHFRAMDIRRMSEKMGMPELISTITLHEFLECKDPGFIHNLLIDDADELLERLAFRQGWHVAAMAITKRPGRYIELEVPKHSGMKITQEDRIAND